MSASDQIPPGPGHPLWTTSAGEESVALRPDGRSVWRYWIERRWSDVPGYVLWVMFNPSKATVAADNGDGALRLCIRRTRSYVEAGEVNVGALRIVNLFARRGTDVAVESWPRGQALAMEEWVGPNNDRHIVEQAGGASAVVLAWGPSLVRRLGARWRADSVRSLLPKAMCLGVSPSGEPYYAGPRGAPMNAALRPYRP